MFGYSHNVLNIEYSNTKHKCSGMINSHSCHLFENKMYINRPTTVRLRDRSAVQHLVKYNQEFWLHVLITRQYGLHTRRELIACRTLLSHIGNVLSGPEQIRLCYEICYRKKFLKLGAKKYLICGVCPLDCSLLLT